MYRLKNNDLLFQTKINIDNINLVLHIPSLTLSYALEGYVGGPVYTKFANKFSQAKKLFNTNLET